MNSELHERLEYLVNFSSQLIFVSGDSIAQQQRTLEAFVYQQHDDTEIAYLTADEQSDASDYRRQLCRQLLGQVVGSFVRPLNELLAELNQHEGPILITITQAQYLPDGLLQELWDLVLQSRFAGNKQHLNVLLFGETKWAEQAKEWLPAKNTDTPLLIGSQSVSSNDTESELDKMIAKRRAQFDAHLAKRAQDGAIPINNRMSSPWFWVIVSLLFVSLFFAIFSWQYGETFSTIFNPIETKTSDKTVSVPDSTLNPPPVITPESSPENSPSSGSTDAAIEESEINDTADPLVTSWQSAIERLPDSAADEVVSLQNEEQTEPNASHGSDQINPLDEAAVQASSAPETLPVELPTEPALSEAASDIESQSVLPEVSNSLDDNQWLLDNVTTGQFVIQIAGMKDRDLMTDFLNDNRLNDTVKVYKTQRYGGDWFVIVYNQTFGDINAAREAVLTLPDYPQRSQAFVKSGAAVLEEVNLAPQ